MPKKPRDSRPSLSTSADVAADDRLRRVAVLAGACVAAGAAAYAMLLAAEPEPLSPVLRKIAREHNISFGDFRRKYLAKSTPVIVDGWSTEPLLTRDDIVQSCGDDHLHDPCDPESIPVKYHARGSHAWAGLADVPRNDAALANFRDLLAAQGNRSFRMSDGEGRALSGAQLYLFDASLAIYCPRLLAKLRAPRYFPVDYLRQMGPRFSTPCEGRPSHPSLFVGPGRSQSGFHRDSFGTRFWMAVHEGSKAFRLTDPAMTLRLKRARPTPCDKTLLGIWATLKRAISERVTSELCGGYNVDLFADGDDAASALMAALAADGERGVIWEGTVGAGELIFIPELWGHQVRNLEPSIAVSYNLIDDFNLRTHATLLLEMQATLELLQPGPMRRPDQLENTQNRVALLGFDLDQRGFPAHSVASLPDDAEGGSWAAFWERNQQREPLELEAYLAQLQEWEEAGGLARVAARFSSL